jgi:hypothetical protein
MGGSLSHEDLKNFEKSLCKKEKVESLRNCINHYSFAKFLLLLFGFSFFYMFLKVSLSI